MSARAIWGRVGVLFALFAGVFDPNMLDPLEVAGDVLDLPTRFRADRLTHRAAAGARFFRFGKIVFPADHRQILERRQVAPAATNPANRARFGQRFIRWQVIWIHRPRFQLPRELQQHLRHVARRLEPVGTRAVVHLL